MLGGPLRTLQTYRNATAIHNSHVSLVRLSRPRGTADLSLLVLTLIWGVNFSVVKAALATVEPLAFNALRFPLAACTLAVLLRRGPCRPRLDRADLPRILVLGTLGNLAYQLCFIVGIDWTLAGNASLLLATTPVWTVAFSAIAGHERPSPWLLTGVVGTLVGMTLVVVGGPHGLALSVDTLKGDILMVVAAVLWSAYTVGGRSPVEKYGALRVTAWTLYVGTPPIVMMGLPQLARTPLADLTPDIWAAVVYGGVLAVGIAYLIWYRGVERLGNNRTAVYSNLVPVAALVVAWLWLGEVPTRLQIVGAGTILVSLTLARIAQSPGPILRPEANASSSFR